MMIDMEEEQVTISVVLTMDEMTDLLAAAAERNVYHTELAHDAIMLDLFR